MVEPRGSNGGKMKKVKLPHTAAKLAPKWQKILSSKYFVLSISALKKSYLQPHSKENSARGNGLDDERHGRS
jgi:hypothetical protein